MSKRNTAAVALLVASVAIVGFGCMATYGVLREYADVCGDTSTLTQVWLSGAGLGPLVAVVAAVLALAIAVVGGARIRWAAAALLAFALVGATVGGAAGIAGKKAAYEEDPATYGGCSGYNS